MPVTSRRVTGIFLAIHFFICHTCASPHMMHQRTEIEAVSEGQGQSCHCEKESNCETSPNLASLQDHS